MGEGVGATGWVILVNAASYAAVIWSLARMRSDELRPVQRLPRGPGQLRDGLRYVRQRPDMLLVLAIVFCAGTFGLNFQMTTALMATEVYAKGAGEYGILGSILAIGSLGGSLLAARRETPHLRIVIGAAAVFGVMVTIAGLMPSYLTFALVLPLCGFSALTMITSANAYMQMAAAPHLRGRVMALYLAVFMGGTPIGAPLLGLVAERYGARWPLIGGGMLTLAGSLLAGARVRPPAGHRRHAPPLAPPQRRGGAPRGRRHHHRNRRRGLSPQNGLRPRRLRTDTISPTWLMRCPIASHWTNHDAGRSAHIAEEPRRGGLLDAGASQALRARRHVERRRVGRDRGEPLGGGGRHRSGVRQQRLGIQPCADIGHLGLAQPDVAGDGVQPEPGAPGRQQRLPRSDHAVDGDVLVGGGVKGQPRQRRPTVADRIVPPIERHPIDHTVLEPFADRRVLVADPLHQLHVRSLLGG